MVRKNQGQPFLGFFDDSHQRLGNILVRDESDRSLVEEI